MSEEKLYPELISGSLLNNPRIREHIENLLQPEIVQVTGYRLDLHSCTQLPELRVCFFTKEHRISLYVPEHLHFSLSDLKEKLLSTYNKKYLPSLNNICMTDIDYVREQYNNKIE
jgi:hypothetical protein